MLLGGGGHQKNYHFTVYTWFIFNPKCSNEEFSTQIVQSKNHHPNVFVWRFLPPNCTAGESSPQNVHPKNFYFKRSLEQLSPQSVYPRNCHCQAFTRTIVTPKCLPEELLPQTVHSKNCHTEMFSRMSQNFCNSFVTERTVWLSGYFCWDSEGNESP